MKLTFVRLLQIQRDLYGLPRNMERFRAYLATMTVPATGDLKLPLVAMNPMGKEHVPALLDEWIALGADDLAARAVAEAAIQLDRVGGEFQVGLVMADDAKGGWTNRYFSEFGSSAAPIEPATRRRLARRILWVPAQTFGHSERDLRDPRPVPSRAKDLELLTPTLRN